MFKTFALIVIGVFVVANAASVVAEENPLLRFFHLLEAVSLGLVFYYIWFT